MTWIDPDYTLGRLAAERERLISSLEQRGLLARNRLLPMARVPLHLGLITSRGSAAEADFLDELRRSGYAWRVASADARVQGRDAATDVVAALEVLVAKRVDAIALIRGGGAQTDLAAFDGEAIAVAVAQTPVPVLTGIGHEIDMSVTDLVARSYKTPTACAAALVGRVRDFVQDLERIRSAVERAAQLRLETRRRDLGAATERLDRLARAAARRSRDTLDGLTIRTVREGEGLLRRQGDLVGQIEKRVARTGTMGLDAVSGTVDRMTAALAAAADRGLISARSHLAELEHRVNMSNPDRLLARGWSITRDDDGAVITDPMAVEPGSRLRTTVAGGELASVVVEESRDD
jgi:exodeoxyribonuclease VII large subunit